jgi:hypothetical protein
MFILSTPKGYIKIYSNGLAFAALRADGSIKAWGDPDFGGKHAPTDTIRATPRLD